MLTFDVASGTTVRLNAIGILGRHTGTVNNGVDAKLNLGAGVINILIIMNIVENIAGMVILK